MKHRLIQSVYIFSALESKYASLHFFFLHHFSLKQLWKPRKTCHLSSVLSQEAGGQFEQTSDILCQLQVL